MSRSVMKFKMLKFLAIILIFPVVICDSENEIRSLLDFSETFKLFKFTNNSKFAEISDTCKNGLTEYIEGISKQEDWAVRMFDSIPKSVDGLLMGHFKIPGHFDECVGETHGNFKGQHCMVRTTFGGKKPDNPNNMKYLDNLIKRASSTALTLSLGLCVPSTCNTTDIKTVLNQVISQIGEINVDIDLNEKDCSTREFRPLRSEDWVTISVLIIIALLATASTAFDVLQRFLFKNDNPNQLWSSFSLYTNTQQLFRISQSAAQLKCLHGIRCLSMFWVVLGHAYFTILFGYPLNFIDAYKTLREKSFTVVSNAFVSVDSFFFLSGLLVCVVFFRDISKKGSFDVPVVFIHRYLRLTPSFALLIMIQATLVSRIGNGPFWNVGADQTEESCRRSWWTAILYVQNYVKPEDMCLGQSWYLSADMQMYWLSPLILYPILWWPYYAPFFILLLTLVAAFTNFTIAFLNNLAPNFSIDLGPNTMNQFRLEYSPFHTRMAPWLIGLATGYIICGIQAKKIRINLSKYWVMMGWLTSTGLCLASLFGFARFLDSEFTQAESSIYLAFHRVGWALGLSWIVIACYSGYGGPVNYILSLDFFQPLGKLSYSLFLIHMTVQQYRLNTARTNQYIRHYEVVYSYFGDLVVSCFLSIPVTLLFEIPFTHIDRYFFQKLEIFPFPRSKYKKKVLDDENEKSENVVSENKDVEIGKVNEAFSESESTKN